MEVYISDVLYFRELLVKVHTNDWRVLSSSLETWPERMVLTVELTKEGIGHARKDYETP